MALTQSERIDISKKQITIPLDQQNIVNTKSTIQDQIVIAQASDDTNKSLMDAITIYIDPYQAELQQYDGNGRNQLTEQDLINSANKVLQNMFFPNDNTISLPSIPDGVWKNFTPFSKNKAIGKQYTEVYTSVSNEVVKINAINATIASIEAFSAQTRSSGEDCSANPNPPPSDIIAPNATIQSLVVTLTSQINDLRSFTLTTKSSVPTIFKTPTMDSENDASRSAVDSLVTAIDSWLLFADFDTIVASICSVFDTYDVSTLAPSKLRATELDPLKTAVLDKETFNTTRQSQLSGYLGSITVNSKGNITSASGWYGDRFRVIDMRLNLITGTLSSLTSLQDSVGTQDESILALDNQIFVYDTLMVTSIFRAPASGNKVIHVIDSSVFSVSDSVFVMSDGKTEISATIVSIDNNTITLSSDVPKPYTPDNIARIYKVI